MMLKKKNYRLFLSLFCLRPGSIRHVFKPGLCSIFVFLLLFSGGMCSARQSVRKRSMTTSQMPNAKAGSSQNNEIVQEPRELQDAPEVFDFSELENKPDRDSQGPVRSEDSSELQDSAIDGSDELKKIHAIVVEGNKLVPDDAIRAKIPYRVGGVFRSQLSSDFIRALYDMGYFKPDIRVSVKNFSPTEVIVYVSVHEKNIVDEICFEGNNNMTSDELDKKIMFSNLKSIDEDDFYRIKRQIKELYVSKDYHDVEVTHRLFSTGDGRVKVVFCINEGSYTLVRRVIFKGNKCVASKKLRSLLFTRENWLFGFLNKAGSYQPDAVEYDKSVIANYYRSNGFLTAQVSDVSVEKDPESPCHFCVTFTIHEGELYCVNKVSAEDNDLLTECEILSHVSVFPGDLYSSEKIRNSMEELRLVLGESGYIFADIIPETEVDEENRTVDIKFKIILGNPITCNSISISGNKKTKEKVIRREIRIDEGELVTTIGMDASKERVERLGFFEPQGGVNWKTTRLDDNRADLDLIVKEAKTGKAVVGLRSGGDPSDIQSPSRSLQVTFGLSESNIRGTGIKGALNVSASRQDQQFAIQIMNPWLFDRPLTLGFDLFYESATYQDIRHFDKKPHERRTGGDILLGWTTPRFGGLSILGTIGAESLHFQRDLTISLATPAFERPDLERFKNYAFQSGTIPWLEGRVIQDQRNNQMQPSRGYLWTTSLRFGIPHHHSSRHGLILSPGELSSTKGFGFVKWDADAHWYFPVINEYDLIFHLHGHVGIVTGLGDYGIPYRELYHVGGPGTVRGFLFGQIGPSLFGDSIGGTKAMWMNAELVFPFTKDYNIVGLAFYDGGASWDAPQANLYSNNGANIQNNQFKFRQSIGLGLKMRSPMPVSIAVGLKLDRDRRSGERISEVHFTSAVDF